MAAGRLLVAGQQRVRGPRWGYAVPQLLIAAGFWLSTSINTVWFVLVVGTLLALTGLALHLLSGAAPSGQRRGGVRGEVRAGDDERQRTGPASITAAAVLATAALVQLGGLLAVRLVIVPEPAAPLLAAFDRTALENGFSTLAQPLLAVAAVLGALWVLRCPAGTRSALLRRVRGGLGRLVGEVGRPDQRPGWPDRQDAPRRAGATDRARAVFTGGFVVVAVLAPFLLPLLGERTGDAALTIGGIATPEYGKLTFLALLAVIVARYSHRFDASGRIRRRDLLRRRAIDAGWVTRVRLLFHAFRYAIYPVALFGLVAFASGLRQDLGTLVAALAGTIGVTWAATRHTVLRFPDAGHGPLHRRTVRRLVRMASAYRHFLGVGAVIFVLATVSVLNITGYVGERARIWADPWVYRWAAGCAEPAPGAILPPVPDGMVACQRSLAADVESERSQLGQVLSAVADGGLWGRGLGDTRSGALPAGSTDFILAVMWDKLGGLVVLSSAVLMVLLGVALARAPQPVPRPPGTPPTVLELFGAGLAAMAVGQMLFVFAATLNVVPHSGVPAPLLSRGGQSTLAILLGVVAVLALTRASAAPTTVPTVPTTVPAARAPRGRLGVLVPVALFATMTAAITVWPYPAPRPADQFLPTSYAEDRPPCAARADSVEGLESPPPHPGTCSTDQFAVDRTRIDIRFATGGSLVQHRPSGRWAEDGNTREGLRVEDMAGLLRVGAGHSGVLENTYAEVLAGSAGTRLGARLRPWPRPGAADGGLDLTIDPRLQHAAAVAMRGNGPGGAGPLAGGMVLIDGRTGHILVAATAPGEPGGDTAGGDTAGDDPVAAARFEAENRYYRRPGQPGGDDGAAPDPACNRAVMGSHGQPTCLRWSVRPQRQQVTGATEATRREVRRYVGGDPSVRPPSPAVNRALGTWYGLGSTFKVVIAAAYLEQPGTTAADLVPAPLTVVLSARTTIHNAGGGACPGATPDGQITLTRALAVSCNTAFVSLARQLGWPRIAEMARRFGFSLLRPGGAQCETARPWLGEPLVGAVPSCVPATTDGVSIGNNALGGQDVRGTPLGLATVMAAVANGGRSVRPTLTRAVRLPNTGALRPTPASPTRTVLAPRVAAELVSALSETAVNGTAAGLCRAVGAPLWVKTGTHEVVPEGTALEPGRFVRQIAWLAGFVDTGTGPVAFAVAVETRDERAGARRVRFLVENMCAALGRRR